MRSGRIIWDCNFPSPSGYYSRKKRLKLDGMTTQKDVTCFFVTGLGESPPVTCNDWTESIITEVIPSFWQNHSGLISSYTQVVSSNPTNKRKRLDQTSDSSASRPHLATLPHSDAGHHQHSAAHPHSDTHPSSTHPHPATHPSSTHPHSATHPSSTHPHSVSPTINPTDLSEEFIRQDYWHSTEAWKVFGVFGIGKDSAECEIKELLFNRLAKFKKAFLTCDGWKDLMEDGDSGNHCKDAFIFNIRKKCKYLYQAVNLALRVKDKNLLRWREICDKAVENIRHFEDCDDLPHHDLPSNTWITGKTVMRWFHSFRQNNDYFINYPHQSSKLDKAPPFFDLNPSFKSWFLQHA